MSAVTDRLFRTIERCYLATTDTGGGPHALARVMETEVDELDPDSVYRAGYFAGFSNALQLVGNGGSMPFVQQAIRDAVKVKEEMDERR